MLTWQAMWHIDCQLYELDFLFYFTSSKAAAWMMDVIGDAYNIILPIHDGFAAF